MDKSVILYRHGKSDWGAAYGDDHDRPLAKRGRKAARAMGRFLGKSGRLPDIAITSTALRAKNTLEISVAEGNWDCEIVENERIYYGTAGEIFDIIRGLPDKYSSVMLVGHEPKWSNLASLMIGGREEVVFKTATMALICFKAPTWENIELGKGELLWIQQPSMLSK